MSDRIIIRPDPDIADLAPDYLEGKRAELAAMSDLLAAGDLEAIAKQAHRILGTAASYGFTDLGRMAGELEQAAQNGNRESVQDLVGRMQSHLQNVEIGPPAD